MTEISNALEEKEREELTRLKVIKRRKIKLNGQESTMCGRYFTDPSVAEELYDTFRIPGTEDVVPAAEDVHPADTADVLVRTPAGIGLERMRWGFPGFEKIS